MCNARLGSAVQICIGCVENKLDHGLAGSAELCSYGLGMGLSSHRVWPFLDYLASFLLGNRGSDELYSAWLCFVLMG